MKQTAVEWLVEQFEEWNSPRKWKEIIEQAKEMEKQQHSNTWDDSRIEDRGDNYLGKQLSFEQYYDKTFNKKQS